jgi:hypothetical protein
LELHNRTAPRVMDIGTVILDQCLSNGRHEFDGQARHFFLK